MTVEPTPEWLPHLQLRRTDILRERRRRGGGGRPPPRDYAQHGRQLSEAAEDVVRRFALPHVPAEIDPALVLKIRLDVEVDDAVWRRNGLVVLAREPGKTVVLFSSDSQLAEFRGRLAEYQEGPRGRRLHPSHNALFASIIPAGIESYGREDRIGRLLRNRTLIADQTYALDLELWPLGTAAQRRRRMNQVEVYIESSGGEVLDQVDNENIFIARIRVSGEAAMELLDMDPVASMDLPPEPSLTVGEVVELTMADLGEVAHPPTDAPSVCVIDSGVNAGHPLLAPAIGDTDVFPAALGSGDDVHGHGTMVAGIALYGRVESCIRSRSFSPVLTVFSARVTNDRNEFDDDMLVLSQMRQAIERFAHDGCRVFNISLGDLRRPYDDGKVSAWAAVLDQLARDLKVLIVVSAGNYDHQPTASPSEVWEQYPSYLLNDEARVLEPATAAIALTVGSLAGAGTPYMSERYPDDPAYRRISGEDEPSPFTRSGPGPQGCVKPELCEFGGDVCFDSRAGRVLECDPNLSVVSLNREYLRRLFTFDHGTSFAAPRVARMSAVLFGQFPEASPNLIRDLLALLATVPSEAATILPNEREHLRVCGYGKPDPERAGFSAPNRVALMAEGELPIDSFHVYELPIPATFCSTRGRRQIVVSLAYDPPTRHTRVDYLGVRMSFRLVRGKTLDEVVQAYRRHGRDEGDPPSLAGSSCQCNMWPGPSLRDTSTLQKASLSMARNPLARYGNTYYLVVRAERRWAPVEVTHQTYAVAVMDEHEALIDLYAEIRQRTEISARVRVAP